MNWKDKPTSDGWYFWRSDMKELQEYPPLIVIVSDEDTMDFDGTISPLDGWDGQWLGPLTPDNFRKVEE